MNALQVTLITDGISHCDVIKLGHKLSLIQPEFAFGQSGF